MSKLVVLASSLLALLSLAGCAEGTLTASSRKDFGAPSAALGGGGSGRDTSAVTAPDRSAAFERRAPDYSAARSRDPWSMRQIDCRRCGTR